MINAYKKLKNTLNNNAVFTALYVILILFFFFRIIGLDRDIPCYGLGFYQAKDEGQYSQMALNYYNNGSLYNAKGIEVTTSTMFRSNILGNILQFLSLLLFGDNYYAFRLPYFLFSFLIIVFCTKTIKLYSKQNSVSNSFCKKYILLMLLFFDIDFPYLLMSRVVENSCLRALFLSVVVYLWLRLKNKNKLRCFIIGMLSILGILCLYFSNITLLITLFALALYKTIYTIKNKIFYKELKDFYLFSFLGIVFGNIIAELYYLLIWKEEAWYNFYKAIFNFSDRIVTVSSSSSSGVLFKYLKIIFKGTMTFTSSNIFFYSTFLGVLLLFSLFINISSLKKYNEDIFFVVTIQIIFIMQAVATNDYAERKAITILPVILLSGFIACYKCFDSKVHNNIDKVLSAYIICLFAFMFYSMFWKRISENYFADFESNDIVFWIICVIAEMFILYSMILFRNETKISHWIAIVVFISILKNGYFDVKYVYKYDLYTEKNAMIGIGKIADNQFVAGPYTYGYTLYNNIYPICNWNTLYNEEIDSGEVYLFCDYSAGPTWVRNMNPENDFSLVKSFERSLRAQGINYPIGIFIKDSKEKGNVGIELQIEKK